MAGLGSAGGDSPSLEESQTASSLLHPLSQFYRRAGWELPFVEESPAAAIPRAARPLLVHDQEMTVRLERYHDTTVGIRVLGRVRRDDVYARQVLLTRAADDTPLGLAAVEIRLDALPPHARAAVLAEEMPLGHILRRVCPTVRRTHHGYFRIHPDAHVRRVLQRDAADVIYGRRGVLVDLATRSVAHVIELVPPALPLR